MFSNILSNLLELVNTREDALRLIISILLGLPIALLHRYTLYGKNPVRQHLFFTTCGLLICYWNYGLNTLHSTATLCITYLILRLFGGTALSVAATFIFTMSYLLYGYYTTGTTDYDIKWTMPQCVLTMRLIGLAFNLLDGKKSETQLSALQKQLALKQKPTFLEIAAFMYFPGSFLVGPQFSMKRYLDYVNGQLMNDKSERSAGNVELPDCLVPGISRMCLGFLYMLCFKLGTHYFPDEYLFSLDFQKQSFLMRLVVIGFWGHVNLYKYICCWLLTEGVCTSFGLSYTGKDEKGRSLWDGCENVQLLTFETASQFNDYILSFNINTNQWCAENIYKRLRFLGSKLYSQFGTLLFLAVWHGFHSGYYVCFFLEFIIMYAEKDIIEMLERHKKLQNLIQTRIELQILSGIIAKVYTFVFMGYSLVPFILLSYPRYHHVYSSVYYCGHVIYLCYPLVSILIKRYLNEKRPRNLNR